MATIIQQRRGTAAEWTAANTILANGEKGLETDGLGTTKVKEKIGNGVLAWNDLPYQESGAVASVNGETGVVVLDTSDIAETTNKKYVTDAEKVVIGNTSGTNTGDQNLSVLALKSNVLELNNTGTFTPLTDYEPATKKYVDDNSGGGGGDITEDGTNLKYGTGSDYGIGGSKRVSAGINTLADGDNSLAIGYNAKAGTKSVAIGNDVGYIAKGVSSLSIGNDIRETEDGSVVICGLTNQSSVGYRTKSKNSVMIGQNLNINSVNPDNTTVNGGTFIGVSLVNELTNVGSKGIMIGNLINRGDAFSAIAIGDNIQMENGYRDSTIFGKNLKLNTIQTPDNVVIGFQAGAETDTITGSVGGQQVVIGKDAYGGSWRCTVIGAFAKADKVSSTVVGYGAYSGMIHGAIVGRGGYLTEYLTGSDASTLLYTENTIIGKAYAKYTNPYVEGNDEIVNNVTEQNNGTEVYRITTASGLDADLTPTVTDTKGAILDISGGVGTGTSESGLLTFSSAPATGVSNNVLNPLEVAAQIDAASGVDTRFMLLDVTTGTVKRVLFGADDSAGLGFKTLKVEN